MQGLHRGCRERIPQWTRTDRSYQNRHAIAGCPIHRCGQSALSHGDSSLGNVFGLSAGAGVGAALSLVVGVDHGATSGVLQSLLRPADDELLGALLLLNFRCLISDLTITGHRSVLLSHVLNF